MTPIEPTAPRDGRGLLPGRARSTHRLFQQPVPLSFLAGASSLPANAFTAFFAFPVLPGFPAVAVQSTRSAMARHPVGSVSGASRLARSGRAARAGRVGAPNDGFTLIEVLVTLLILGGTLLGLAMAQNQALRTTQQSEYRSLATFLAYDLADRIRANGPGRVAGEYANLSGASRQPSCTGAAGCDAQAMAKNDKYEWQQLLGDLLPNGAGELEGGAGGMRVRVLWDQRGSQGSERHSYELRFRP